jgi:hypothetical protein
MHRVAPKKFADSSQCYNSSNDNLRLYFEQELVDPTFMQNAALVFWLKLAIRRGGTIDVAGVDNGPERSFSR